MFAAFLIRPVQRTLRRNVLTGTIYAAASLCFGSNCYLREIGWWKSFRARSGVDGKGEPLPWITYPAIDFLSNRVDPDWDIFEYGSGNSTLWWADRANQVTSCEHDSAWFEFIESRIPGNVTLLHRHTDDGSYMRVLEDYPESFDVIVIDGIERTECAQYILSALKRSGVVIWDNSDKNKYISGIDKLELQGFRRLDFYGPGPASVRGWSTSIFYRQDNCLGL